ncbi:MAG: hypothetical protein AAF992_02590 [Bacteroidota bacterium]
MKEELPTEPPEPKKTWLEQLPIRLEKKFWNSEKIISLSAFVVSIATLLALMYQIRLSGEQNELVRKEQYASVLPYLEIWPSSRSSTHFSLGIVNNGIGPAFIDEVKVVYEGQEYEGDPNTFYYSKIIETDTVLFAYGSVGKGHVLRAGEERGIIETNVSRADADKLKYWFGRPTADVERAKVEITYSSVYGERWVTRGIAAIPEPLSTEDAN